MPNADTTLYAQFAPDEYAVTVTGNPSAGGAPTVDGGTSHGFGTSVTVHANTPNAGYCFVNWSTNADGGRVVSRKPDYAFTMPAGNYALYANYAKAIFVEGFEGLKTGAAQGKGTLDMNFVGGDNACSPGIGNGNPWWGTNPFNGSAGLDPAYTGVNPHTGSAAAWSGYAGNGRDYVNLAYRCNGGSAYTDSVYLDWWFYDPCGTDWDLKSGKYCDDSLSLVKLSTLPTDTDYPSSAATHNFDDSEFAQKLSLGMADDWCTVSGFAPYQVYTPHAGFDHTKYQARIKDGQANETAFHDGWYNLDVTRSIGWHHARIIIGAPDSDTSTNPVAFYIDDLSTAAMTGTMSSGINAAELVTCWKQGDYTDTATVNWPAGAMYDDIVFGVPEAAPSSAPAAGAATAVTTNSITWNWTQSGIVNGFHVFDAAVGGAEKGGDLTAATLAETGLAANTRYSRWVSSYLTPVKTAWWESTRTPLTPTYTLAAVPVFGTTGSAAVNCNFGLTDIALPSEAAVFTAVNGFGAGSDKADSYRYVWDNSAADPNWDYSWPWTSGTLSLQSSGFPRRYLHLRAVNGDGVVNPTSATFGPYYFGSQCMTMISDLWQWPNDTQHHILYGKTVTGAVGGAFWIQEPHMYGYAAIKVIWNGSLIIAQGHSVDVVGTLDASSGQRVMIARAVEDNGVVSDDDKVEPITMVGRAIGGKAINAFTPGVTNGTGLYNIGMLVRTVGKVTTSGADFFFLDDGSGLKDGENTGIKVLCGSVTPPTEGTKTVTGVVDLQNGKPVLIIRGTGDIQ